MKDSSVDKLLAVLLPGSTALVRHLPMRRFVFHASLVLPTRSLTPDVVNAVVMTSLVAATMTHRHSCALGDVMTP